MYRQIGGSAPGAGVPAGFEEALDAVVKPYEAATGNKVAVSYAASNAPAIAGAVDASVSASSNSPASASDRSRRSSRRSRMWRISAMITRRDGRSAFGALDMAAFKDSMDKMKELVAAQRKG